MTDFWIIGYHCIGALSLCGAQKCRPQCNIGQDLGHLSMSFVCCKGIFALLVTFERLRCLARLNRLGLGRLEHPLRPDLLNRDRRPWPSWRQWRSRLRQTPHGCWLTLATRLRSPPTDRLSRSNCHDRRPLLLREIPQVTVRRHEAHFGSKGSLRLITSMSASCPNETLQSFVRARASV